MIAAVINRKQIFIPVICAVLILLIGFKVLSPVLKLTRLMIKELSLAVEDPDADKTEKKGDTDKQDKTEYINIAADAGLRQLAAKLMVHISNYAVHYISAHFYQITTPPPDFTLPTQS